MTETDETFLRRFEPEPFPHIKSSNGQRLLALALRGAAVPDEPTAEMTRAGIDESPMWLVAHNEMHPDDKIALKSGRQRCSLSTEECAAIYRAMLQAALKDTPRRRISNAEHAKLTAKDTYNA